MVSVTRGIVMHYGYQQGWLKLTLSPDQVVNISVPELNGDFFGQVTFPDFSSPARLEACKVAVFIAIIASLETLLRVEVASRLDPYKRNTLPNRVLMAQALGNILTGLCGGLPNTQVIVNSSANISFDTKSKLSVILHGMFILIYAVTLAELLNMISLASFAAILIVDGYQLTRPALCNERYRLGWDQFIPFIATIIGMVTTDLLRGMAFGTYSTLRQSDYNSHDLKEVVNTEKDYEIHHILLAEELSLFTKASLFNHLSKIPKNAYVIIDVPQIQEHGY